MTHTLTRRIHEVYRQDLAHAHVGAISQHHRIQASPGYRAAAGYVAAQLAAAGIETTIRSYPADGKAVFWSTPSFLEWECREAMLHLLDKTGAATERLCDFAAVPTSLIQRSMPAAGDFRLVALPGEGGAKPDDYRETDVAGKLVLTDRPVAAVHRLAVRQHGAAGILFDGMALGGRSTLDLPDARQYTSFWWAGGTAPDGWGFVLSPRMGRQLRDRLARGEEVAVRATVDARFYAGTYEVVEASIAGSDPTAGEVLLVSHLCHPKPGAHDNASGAAALIETAATLTRMRDAGSLPALKRGIRFIWPPEMTGTYAWLAAHEASVAEGRWLAGLNLDMVGADQPQTGSTWQLVDLPLASASFADHLLAWLREPLLAGQRHEETPFSGGSDHYILSDPTVGIPAPMLIQWPDRYYHTSDDTPDRVSPDSLGRSGALAAAYAAWLASAGAAETRWLGNWMVARYSADHDRAFAAITEEMRAAPPVDRRPLWDSYRRRAALRRACMDAALRSLSRLDPDWEPRAQSARISALDSAANAAAAAEWGVSSHGDTPLVEASGEAGGLIPRRLTYGPIDAGMALQASSPDRLPDLWRLGEEARGSHDAAALLQYWADGSRTVAEIAALVSIEAERAMPAEQALRYFRLLEATGHLSLVESHDG